MPTSVLPASAQTTGPLLIESAAPADPNPNHSQQTFYTFMPMVSQTPLCPQTSSASYGTVGFLGSPYKDNRLTDENADFRLSVLGYAPVTDQFGLSYAYYGGSGGNGDGPRLHGLFEPNRVPGFVNTYQVYHWNWNESAPPPYGARGALNSTEPWKVMVLDVATTPGERIYIPERNANINDTYQYKAMVLYASERELTLAYFLRDHVLIIPDLTGYVVHLLNLCVDPNLVQLYKAQLSAGKRATMQLPALRANQALGTALGNTITVAVRDGARFMDPRVQSDWWYGLP